MELNLQLDPTITKDYLLSKFSEETYMEYYSGLPVVKKLQTSKLRADHKPTVAFYRNRSGELIYKDFGDNTCANFVGLAMLRYNCSYFEALKRIAEDFGLKHSSGNQPIVKVKVSTTKFVHKGPSNIRVEVQNFTDADKAWWNQFGITPEILSKYHVFSCKHVFLDNRIFASSSDSCPIFGYYFGKENGIEKWRIYMPKRKEYRFISNTSSSIIQGYAQLPKSGPLLIITKAQKDCMAFNRLGIPAIAPNSECLFVSDEMLEELKTRFKHVVVMYDHDRTGMRRLVEIRKEHPELKYIYMPKCTECKDFTDFIQKEGLKEAKKLVKQYLVWLSKL